MITGNLTKIIDNYLRSLKPDAHRNYIGASGIGSSCLRKIWYQFNGEKEESFTPHIKRIFLTGKVMESMVLNLLVESGIEVQIPDESNNFFKCQDKELSYFQGNYDALLLSPKRILEVKTAKNSSFSTVVKNGIYKWDQRYYGQLQSYMGMTGIHSSCILVINKDNSELYDEIVDFKLSYYELLKAKAKIIYESKEPLSRVNNSPAWWECKICQFKEKCHDK